jgi:hypothetical protein
MQMKLSMWSICQLKRQPTFGKGASWYGMDNACNIQESVTPNLGGGSLVDCIL